MSLFYFSLRPLSALGHHDRDDYQEANETAKRHTMSHMPEIEDDLKKVKKEKPDKVGFFFWGGGWYCFIRSLLIA